MFRWEMEKKKTRHFLLFFFLFFFTVAYSNLPKQFVVTSQQLKEELQKASGVDQIFIPHKNQRLAESLSRTGRHQKHFTVM